MSSATFFMKTTLHAVSFTFYTLVHLLSVCESHISCVCAETSPLTPVS
jgi:hypothetical protein